MRRTFLYILIFSCLTAAAQITSYDRLTLGEQDLMGTSRYVGMAGAMAAVGGDASAAGDNPAGLGLYRRSELMITLDYQLNRPSLGTHTSTFSCGQASWNFCFLQDRMKGVIGNNIMLNYRRIKNFYRETGMKYSDMNFSQTDVMAMKTDGLKEKDLEGSDAWYDSEIGWLSIMGYQGYLIDPDTTAEAMWLPANTGMVNGALTTRESGSIDEFSLGWGMNISNQWYLGLEMGVRSLTYAKSTYYDEQFANRNRYYLDSYVTASGVGFVSKVGIICRPTSFLRLGAAFHAPVPMAFSLHNYAEMKSETTSGVVKLASLENNNSPSSFVQPMRGVFGLAFQLGTKGLLSMEYDYQHDLSKDVLDTHWTKVGLEGVIANNWFINLGYALRFRQPSNGKWSDPICEISYNSVRLDTEFYNLQYAHYISGGLSFRHKYFIVGAAYQCRLMKENVHFHELQTEPIALANTSHKIVVSLSWRH